MKSILILAIVGCIFVYAVQTMRADKATVYLLNNIGFVFQKNWQLRLILKQIVCENIIFLFFLNYIIKLTENMKN